eukprot:COSAG01_NODE_7357_length_3235_cov_8.278521_2_plen_258_part_00
MIDGQRFVDGGVRENNPVRIARNEAQDIWPGRAVGLIVSLGCGLAIQDIGDGAPSAGLITTARKAATELSNPQSRHVEVLQDFAIRHLRPEQATMHGGGGLLSSVAAWGDNAYSYGGVAKQPRQECFRNCRYIRLNPHLTRNVKMDATDKSDLASLRQDTGTPPSPPVASETSRCRLCLAQQMNAQRTPNALASLTVGVRARAWQRPSSAETRRAPSSQTCASCWHRRASKPQRPQPQAPHASKRCQLLQRHLLPYM